MVFRIVQRLDLLDAGTVKPRCAQQLFSFPLTAMQLEIRKFRHVLGAKFHASAAMLY